MSTSRQQPTPRQKRLARALVENAAAEQPLNTSALLEKVGYTPKVARHKQRDIIESEGVKEELVALGFDVLTAKEVVGDILTDATHKAVDRLRAADMVFNVHGTYAPDKAITLHVETTPEALKAAQDFDEYYSRQA